MLDLFLNFFRALADAIPKLYELYRDNQQEEKIVELLESYFILGDLIYSAEELLLIVRNKDKVDLSGLSLPELKAELHRIESVVSLQKLRLKRLGNIYLTNKLLSRTWFIEGRVRKGKKLAVLSIGAIAPHIDEAISKCEVNDMISHYDMRFVKPLDENLLHSIFKTYKEIITIEDGVISGGFGSAVLEFASLNNYFIPIKILGVPDKFIEHASVKQQHQSVGIDVENLIMLFNSIALRLQ